MFQIGKTEASEIELHKEEKGHLEHTLHLIADLHDLHLQPLKLPAGAHYRATFAKKVIRQTR